MVFMLEAMDEQKIEMEKMDEIMLPGFRFHPTDEELVGFYLRRKIQQRPLSIELIRQLDIYKYDPWDLPKMATTGEKEWYFYCPRDRKYRNSARPNRVTGAGFWKATGTDRPIYSSEGTKCIGLKKSLVFYKGRAAKGIKTDWMMHEFRLPSLTDPTHSKRPLDKNFIPANESWAICRIFKKTNTSAQRALSHSWVSSFPETADSDKFSAFPRSMNGTNFASENISRTAESGSAIQFGCNALEHYNYSMANCPSLDFTTFKSINLTGSKSSEITPASFMFSAPELSTAIKPSADAASMLLNLSPSMIQDSPSIEFESNGFSVTNFPLETNGSLGTEEEDMIAKKALMSSFMGGNNNSQWGNLRTMNFPFNLTSNSSEEYWKLNFPWESTLCPSEISSTCYSSNLASGSPKIGDRASGRPQNRRSSKQQPPKSEIEQAADPKIAERRASGPDRPEEGFGDGRRPAVWTRPTGGGLPASATGTRARNKRRQGINALPQKCPCSFSLERCRNKCCFLK